MKNLGIRISACMLVVWYSLSVIGFGVHTCSESNRSFLTSFITGISCEDVHPAELCSDSCCGHQKAKPVCKCCHEHHKTLEASSDDALRLTSKTCCSDEYQQIDITGSGQNYSIDLNLLPVYSAYCCVLSVLDDILTYSTLTTARQLSVDVIQTGVLRPLLSIWRI